MYRQVQLTSQNDSVQDLPELEEAQDVCIESVESHLSNSRGIRSTIISHVLFDCGLRKRQDVTNDVLPNRIRKSLSQRDAFIAALNDHMNPFSNQVRPEMLYNISTGQLAPVEVANFLLNGEDHGQKQRMEMIAKCSED